MKATVSRSNQVRDALLSASTTPQYLELHAEDEDVEYTSKKRKKGVSRSARPSRKKGKFAFILNEMPIEIISRVSALVVSYGCCHLYL